MSGALYQECVACGRWTFNVSTASCESARCSSRQSAGDLALRPARETIVSRASHAFAENVASELARANEWRERTLDRVQERLESALWGADSDHVQRTTLQLALVCAIGAVMLVGASSETTGVAFVGLLVVSAIVGALLSLVAVLGGLLGTAFWLLLIAPALVYTALAGWLPLYFGGQLAVLAGRLSLLVPLGGFVAATRAKQAWDGIFFTCPSRSCAYRGLPAYVCPLCGESVRDLWPNLYGLFEHECPSCGEVLPTLDRGGRNGLERRCGGCDIPLMGRHAGRARERLVAIAGGTGSGKTNYLLMAVAEATTGHAALHGEIDDDAQQDDFRREWRNLTAGVPAPKTSEVANAFLLYATVGGARCQLYLYDAPGEEFASIGTMAAHQYFPLLEGIVLLVDPLGFEAVRERVGTGAPAGTPLGDVVTSTLVAASAGKTPDRDGKIPLRVAVVISKADLEPVRELVGDVRTRAIRGASCREALVAWGAQNAVRAVEHRFREVEYFASSPLGRSAETGAREPFTGHGIVEPLVWVLEGDRAT